MFEIIENTLKNIAKRYLKTNKKIKPQIKVYSSCNYRFALKEIVIEK